MGPPLEGNNGPTLNCRAAADADIRQNFAYPHPPSAFLKVGDMCPLLDPPFESMADTHPPDVRQIGQSALKKFAEVFNISILSFLGNIRTNYKTWSGVENEISHRFPFANSDASTSSLTARRAELGIKTRENRYSQQVALALDVWDSSYSVYCDISNPALTPMNSMPMDIGTYLFTPGRGLRRAGPTWRLSNQKQSTRASERKERSLIRVTVPAEDSDGSAVADAGTGRP
ncbi:hypothetical protein V1506DRAFT_570775 [Lipomyces tetrasporus]